MAQVAPGEASDHERRRSVIIGATTWGLSSSIRDSEQLLSLKSVGEVPEEGGIVGASVRSPERAGGEVEVKIPENESEDSNDVRTRLDAILGVLSGGGRSSTRGGSGSERHRRDPSIGGRSSETRRRRSTSRTSQKKEEVPKSENEAPEACNSEVKTLRSALKHRSQSYEPRRRIDSRSSEKALEKRSNEVKKGLKYGERSQSTPLRKQVVLERGGRSSSDRNSSDDDDGNRRRRRTPERMEVSRSPIGRRQRSPSSSGGSDGDDFSEFVTGSRRRQIRPGTYDGTTSFETFWAHFECCSEYNRWRSSDKLAHLKAALVEDAGQVLLDSDPKDIRTVERLEALLRRRFSGSRQSDKHRMELILRRKRSGESLAALHQDI